MSKIVVLGLEGENGLWVADLEAGTVTAVAADVADGLRKAGDITSRGVSFAAIAKTAEPLSGGFLDK
ncbi:MAG TPA: hypothetical protein VGN93_19770 [Shinella sp.]|jgi:hypothetical protein|uniref:hypothetical protein n=1 Tax=Shinella sp. TaxID=1870904 RepID=UPI0029B8954E|nr:hypothetical protein [Shinella sp.]MDX3976412.1 hypothetical protein [Shinella sp.]HEV7249217.1 hypothetical protein [Shinella sp.]